MKCRAKWIHKTYPLKKRPVPLRLGRLGIAEELQGPWLLSNPSPHPSGCCSPEWNDSASAFPRTAFLCCQDQEPLSTALPASLTKRGGRWLRFTWLLNAFQFEAKQSNQVGLCRFAHNILALEQQVIFYCPPSLPGALFGAAEWFTLRCKFTLLPCYFDFSGPFTEIRKNNPI